MPAVKKHGVVKWTMLSLAAVFLFNPNIGIVDILPDFIGYLLICAALSRVSAVEEKINDARLLFIRMAFITLLRFVSLFVTFGLIPPSDQSMTMLLLSFVFDVLELMTVLPAIVKLSDGILYAAERHGGEAAYAPVREKKGYRRNITESWRRTALIFACAKALFGTLPEFASLTGQSGWDESPVEQLYIFIGLFRAVGMILSLIFGIIFLIKTLKYISRVRKDSVFLESLSGAFDTVLKDKPQEFARRAIILSFWLFGASAVFMLDFELDGYNIIPDVLAAVSMIVGLLMIRKYITKWKIPALFATIFTISSTVQTVLEYSFASKYYIENADVDPATYSAYMMICWATVVSMLCFAAMTVAFVLGPLKEIIAGHTGFSGLSDQLGRPSEKIRLLHRSLNRRGIAIAVLSILLSVITVAAAFLVNEEAYIILSDTEEDFRRLLVTFDFLGVFEFIAAGVFAVVTIKTLITVKSQIDEKYLLS